MSASAKSGTIFTPGPWWYSDRMVKTVARGEYICEVSGSMRSELHIGDANLIAAAPDLYEALRAFLEQARDDVDDRRLSPEVLAAEAALAKADGSER